MSNLPTLVFVPGSWHRATCYSKITKLLEERHKLKCLSITLPSTTGNPAATFKDDLDAVREAISSETGHGRDVVVIAHSYGGMVGNSAIKGFAQPPRRAAPQTDQSQTPPTAGHVIGLILIASGFTFSGLAFMDPFFGRPPPSWRVNKATGYAELVAPPREFFYHDLPTDEADYWVSQLMPQSLKALFEGGEFSYSGWMDVPAWYIGTVEDRGLPVVAQRMNVGMARAMGATVEHRELQTSHSPFLSQPEETAGIIWEAVERFTGKPPVEGAPARRGQSNQVTVPAARLWQPLTWYRFGLPLVFGHLVGRGVLIFGWCRRLWSSR
ncbi:Alpha/beta hydrolase family-domain-containing protein [Chaetomidium leptoderma]|uniref:Alpha/beta hydrolase family-domain-containing protein n=1 Tax=Chaetomidium leptoderma TaxID=669021 RepID=A0AAN6ZWH7_9PEZI|nr:Alpha/beta hydrolase family-domain-containing protein [Chaetomidium leptoderma]